MPRKISVNVSVSIEDSETEMVITFKSTDGDDGMLLVEVPVTKFSVSADVLEHLKNEVILFNNSFKKESMERLNDKIGNKPVE